LADNRQMQRWQRASLGVIVGTLVVLTTAGCTVESRAVAGVGVGADGSPIGYLKVCSEHIDGATVYQTDDDHLGKWTVKPSATGFATWSFAYGGNGWTVSDAFVRLPPEQTYSLYGWTDDNTSSADAVDFTLAGLASMKPGQVRYWFRGADPDGKQDGYVVTSVEQFRAHACDGLR
jgi:hypothetical protein